MTLTINKVSKNYKPKYDRLDGLSNRYDELDKLAILYNKTKDKKYSDQWFKLVKEIVRQI